MVPLSYQDTADTLHIDRGVHQPEIRPLDKTDLSSEETGVGRELWGGTVAEVRLPPLVDGDPPHAPALGGRQ